MKKKAARKVIKHKKYSRGALGAGMAYAILAMLVVVAAGTAMIGNIVPTGKDYGQPVVVMTHTPDGAKSNLQLETFPGATYTPTPTPTATPTPTDPPPPPSNGGGGGNSAPDSGGAPAGPGIGYSIGAYLLALTGRSQ